MGLLFFLNLIGCRRGPQVWDGCTGGENLSCSFEKEGYQISVDGKTCKKKKEGIECGNFFLPKDDSGWISYITGSKKAKIVFDNSKRFGRFEREIYLPSIKIIKGTDSGALTNEPSIFEVRRLLDPVEGSMTYYSNCNPDSNDPRLWWFKKAASQWSFSFYPVAKILLPTSQDQPANEYKILTYKMSQNDGAIHFVFNKDGQIVTVFPDPKIDIYSNAQNGEKEQLGNKPILDLTKKKPWSVRIERRLKEGILVRFIQPHDTLVYNNMLLEIEMQNEMAAPLFPKSLIEGLRQINIWPTDQGYKYEYGGDYSSGITNIYRARGMGPLIHELTHYWGIDSKKKGVPSPGKASHIFYRISWAIGDWKSNNYPSVPLEGGKSGWDDFIDNPDFKRSDERPYGRRNGTEDMADWAEAYFSKGGEVRKKVRKEMEKGNFEPAVKYLFIKHFPFRSMEYDREEEPFLIYGEVEKAIHRFESSSRRKVRPQTKKAFEMIATYSPGPIERESPTLKHDFLVYGEDPLRIPEFHPTFLTPKN